MVAGKILQAGGKIASGVQKGFSGVKWEKSVESTSSIASKLNEKPGLLDRAKNTVDTTVERTSQRVKDILDNTLTPDFALAGADNIALNTKNLASNAAKG